MHKNTLLLILLTFSIFTINGQSNMKYGLKGGLNYSNFIDNNKDDISADYKAKIGFYFGIFLSIGINDKISIKPELVYSQQGSDFKVKNSDINITSPNDDFIASSIGGEIKESLLLLPIILEYELNEKLSLEFGPQLGYVLNRAVEYDNNSFNYGFLRNDDKEKFELGIGLGIGYSLSEDLNILLRYNYGLIERQNLNTSVFQLGINYKL